MAKKKTNVRKQLDLSKYSPQALVQRGLSEKALRRIYSDFRNIAKKRIAALIKKGYGKVEEVKTAYFPPLKEVAEKPSPDFYLKAKIFEMAKFLNNPLTLLRNQKDRVEIKSMETLRKHGHEIAASNYENFGNFMEAVKSRAGALLYDSERAVQFYEDTKNRRIKPEELAKGFFEWQSREIKTIVENMVLMRPDDYKEKLEERGIDYNAYKRGEYNQLSLLPPRSGALSGENTKKKKKRRK